MLIAEYKANLSMFTSTVMRKEEVWNEVSKTMQDCGYAFSGVQCSAKWKSLKLKYGEKLLNMSTKASGESALHFEFFNELDAVLGRDPAFRPISTASSTSGFERPETSACSASRFERPETSVSAISDDDENVASPTKKKKKVTLQREMLKMMTQMNKDREARNIQKEISERKKDEMRQQLMFQQQDNSEKFLTLLGKIVDKF